MTSDKARMDWLQSRDVRLSAYEGGAGDWEIYWFDREPTKDTHCKACGNTKPGGFWPHARGATLREAVDAGMKADRHLVDATRP